MTSPSSRRASRVATAIAGFAIAALALAGCAPSADSASVSSGDAEAGLGDLTVQLSWIKNEEFAGEFFADSEGYYTDAGFDSVTLVPGPSTGAAELISRHHRRRSLRRRLDRLGRRLRGRAAEDHRHDVPEEPVHDPLAQGRRRHRHARGPDRQEDRRAGLQHRALHGAARRQRHRRRPSVDDRARASTTRRRSINGEVDGFIAYLTNESITVAAPGYEIDQPAVRRQRPAVRRRDHHGHRRRDRERTATSSRRS